MSGRAKCPPGFIYDSLEDACRPIGVDDSMGWLVPRVYDGVQRDANDPDQQWLDGMWAESDPASLQEWRKEEQREYDYWYKEATETDEEREKREGPTMPWRLKIPPQETAIPGVKTETGTVGMWPLLAPLIAKRVEQKQGKEAADMVIRPQGCPPCPSCDAPAAPPTQPQQSSKGPVDMSNPMMGMVKGILDMFTGMTGMKGFVSMGAPIQIGPTMNIQTCPSGLVRDQATGQCVPIGQTYGTGQKPCMPGQVRNAKGQCIYSGLATPGAPGGPGYGPPPPSGQPGGMPPGGTQYRGGQPGQQPGGTYIPPPPTPEQAMQDPLYASAVDYCNAPVSAEGSTCPDGYVPWPGAFDEEGNQICWPIETELKPGQRMSCSTPPSLDQVDPNGYDPLGDQALPANYGAPYSQDQYAQPGYAQPYAPSYAQPGYAQPGYAQPGYAQPYAPSYAQPGYAQPYGQAYGQAYAPSFPGQPPGQLYIPGYGARMPPPPRPLAPLPLASYSPGFPELYDSGEVDDFGQPVYYDAAGNAYDSNGQPSAFGSGAGNLYGQMNGMGGDSDLGAAPPSPSKRVQQRSATQPVVGRARRYRRTFAPKARGRLVSSDDKKKAQARLVQKLGPQGMARMKTTARTFSAAAKTGRLSPTVRGDWEF